MSEYKRLISYIYNYEKGIKKNNVGFAKVELRNGQCKISINIKAASLNGQKLRTYVFYRENKKMIQILLAESGVKNGGFEWKGITNASNIMNTGHNFNQLGGVLLYYSMDKYFATEWDDQPIMLTRLYEWDETESWKSKEKDTISASVKEKVKEIVREENKETVKAAENKEPKFVEIPRDEITYIKQKKAAEEAVSKSQEEIVQSILNSIDSGWELFCNTQNDTKTKRKTNTKKKAKPEKLELQGAELDDGSETITNAYSELEDSIPPETAKLVGYRFINWYRSQETGFPAVAEVNVSNVENQEPNVEKELIIEQENDMEGLEEVAATLFEEEQSFYDANTEKEWNDRLEEVAKKKTSTAERILQKYPAIYPFEDDEIVACVRIEPGDIGLFPIENWVLGNNSFLLHGYYNFRHLIFAKRRVLDGEEFILGVPGVYQNREKFMAKMFGFAQFKCSKNVEQKTGEFGYWYLKINM